METVFIILGVFVLIILYVLGIYFNNKTKIPEECDIPSIKCEHCKSTTCAYSKENKVEEIKDKVKNDHD